MSATPIGIDVSDEGGTRTLALTGELDMTTVDEVEAAAGTPPAGSRLVIDLRGLSFMDSCGVRLFMRLDLRARREDWTVALIHGGGMIARVLELGRMEERMEVQAA